MKHKSLFEKMNDDLSVSSMIGRMESDTVDYLMTYIKPATKEINLIMKKYSVLDQHLKNTSASFYSSVICENVNFKRVMTREGNVSAIKENDGFLFYKDKKYNNSSTRNGLTFYRCIRFRKGNLKCLARVKCEGQNVLAVKETQHNHP